ncbi:MAG: TRAP transporter TatT component family protein [Paracoccaceae bacterium]
MIRKLAVLICLAAIGAQLPACSPSRMAANLAGRALASGGDVYSSEEDPELLMAALPFGLKTMESLIRTSPDNQDLRLASARGLTAYAYLVQQTHVADPYASSAEQRQLDHRVARLFLRGRNDALAALELRHPGFTKGLRRNRGETLAQTVAADAELLYWAGAAWSGAISADKRDLEMVAELSLAAALVQRSARLDETFNGGAAQEFLMLYEAGRPGGSDKRAERYYRRAVKLSGNTSAGAHVGFAEAIAVRRQDRAAFRAALNAALAIDIDAVPERRLTNVLAQRRARRLLEEEDLLFFAPEEEGETS